jgi:hypothetical protein
MSDSIGRADGRLRSDVEKKGAASTDLARGATRTFPVIPHLRDGPGERRQLRSKQPDADAHSVSSDRNAAFGYRGPFGTLLTSTKSPSQRRN